MVYIGIDTSNYKTSIAAIDDDGRLVCNVSEYLEVPSGDLGLRQSEAFFKHSNKLPDFCSRILKALNPGDIAAIGVSSRPRRVEGSYMPCFLAGVNLARVLSEAYNIPLHEFSHQEGHAAAVIESSDGESMPRDFIFMHLSGGTTEFLKCKPDNQGYNMDIIGGTLDISMGQLLDRFGHALGFDFPAGKYIDKLASAYNGTKLPALIPEIRITDGYFNLSGPETVLLKYADNYVKKFAAEGISRDADAIYPDELSSVSYELMDRLADVLFSSSAYLTGLHNIDTVYMAGGVASSSVIKNIIKHKIETESKDRMFKIKFADPELCGDNAVGIALLTRRMHGR